MNEENEVFLTRILLAKRWGCSVSTIKRREREGLIRPFEFNARNKRYKLSQIVSIEKKASITSFDLDAYLQQHPLRTSYPPPSDQVIL